MNQPPTQERETLLLHAAELLEDEAEALKTGHTINGEWPEKTGLDRRAKAEYDDLMDTAKWLRHLTAHTPPVTVEEAFETRIVKPLRGLYDEKQRIGDFTMFSLGYSAALRSPVDKQPNFVHSSPEEREAIGIGEKAAERQTRTLSEYKRIKAQVETPYFKDEAHVRSVMGKETPETDAAEYSGMKAVHSNFARTLERERDEARRERDKDVAIEWSRTQVIEAARRALGDHNAPDDCFSMGPSTGDPIKDFVICPGCVLLNEFRRLDAIQSTQEKKS